MTSKPPVWNKLRYAENEVLRILATKPNKAWTRDQVYMNFVKHPNCLWHFHDIVLALRRLEYHRRVIVDYKGQGCFIEKVFYSTEPGEM
jgi:hypothetical protein